MKFQTEIYLSYDMYFKIFTGFESFFWAHLGVAYALGFRGFIHVKI